MKLRTLHEGKDAKSSIWQSNRNQLLTGVKRLYSAVEHQHLGQLHQKAQIELLSLSFIFLPTLLIPWLLNGPKVPYKLVGQPGKIYYHHYSCSDYIFGDLVIISVNLKQDCSHHCETSKYKTAGRCLWVGSSIVSFYCLSFQTSDWTKTEAGFSTRDFSVSPICPLPSLSTHFCLLRQ